MPFFKVPLSGQPWANADRSPTTEFFRFISNLANSAGMGGATSSISVTASPFVFTTSIACVALVQGGTVSKVEMSIDGTNYFDTGVTAGAFTLKPQWNLRVTYSAAPTMTQIPS